MTADRSAASQNDLLQYLQRMTGCAYISDLHLPINYPSIRSVALNIGAADYPVEAWNAALLYITGDAVASCDAEAVRELLLKRLDQSNT